MARHFHLFLNIFKTTVTDREDIQMEAQHRNHPLIQLTSLLSGEVQAKKGEKEKSEEHEIHI